MAYAKSSKYYPMNGFILGILFKGAAFISLVFNNKLSIFKRNRVTAKFLGLYKVLT